jgi:hypothetical protein
MKLRSHLVPRDHDDAGIGVITVIMVIAVLTAFLVTATTMTVNNLSSTSRDRQALSALSTSEAGVAQAIQFLRGGNLSALTCMEPAAGTPLGATCQGPGPSWISATNPNVVVADGSGATCLASTSCFKVWIGTVQKYVPNCVGRHAVPPTACFGVYRVHSTGVSGGGPSARKLAVDVKVTPYPFPIGVFSEAMSGNGNVGVHSESIFTNGCVMNRQDDSNSGSGVQFSYDLAAGRTTLDLIYEQPTAAHATGKISTSNQSCGTDGNAYPIHETSKTNTTSKPCNTIFKWDQDAEGGALTSGDGCYGAYTRSDGTIYPTTSSFTQADLQNYGYRPRGLTDAQYDALRSQAQAQGTYNIATGAIKATLTSLAASGITSPVLFWDNTSVVSVSESDFPTSFTRTINSAAVCGTNSVTIVVVGPNNSLSYQGGNTSYPGPFLVASVFVPDGTLTGSGGRNTIGTVFAKSLDLGGNVDFYMDQCFANNPPGATLDAQVLQWREDDGTDLN